MTNARDFAAGAFALACTLSLVVACSGTGLTLGDAGDDAGEGAILDGGLAEAGDAPDATEASPAPCAPDGGGRHAPTPPKAVHRDLCPDDLFTYAAVRCTFGDPTVPSDRCDQARASSNWKDCYTCIFGGATSTDADGGDDAGGPYAVPILVTDGLAQLNVGACLDLNEGVIVGQCATSFYEERECQRAACEHCAPEGLSRYEECVALANQDTCHGLLSNTCGLEASQWKCDVGSDFAASAEAYARRFCTRGD